MTVAFVAALRCGNIAIPRVEWIPPIRLPFWRARDENMYRTASSVRRRKLGKLIRNAPNVYAVERMSHINLQLDIWNSAAQCTCARFSAIVKTCLECVMDIVVVDVFAGTGSSR